MYKTNIEGTANVANIALEKGIKRFVHISSVSAFGNTGQKNHVNEEKNGKKVKSIPAMRSASTFPNWKCGVQWRRGLNAVIVNPAQYWDLFYL